MRLSHIGWNLGGMLAPLAVAALTVPSLIERLGGERFGLLALAWGLIGYAGSLDLGIGRALTQLVARLTGERRPREIPDALVTAGRITLVTGLLGALLIGAFALLGGARFVRTLEVPASEIASALLLLAIALPAQAMSATYKGINEAYLNFRSISLVRAGLGVVTFAGPWLVASFTVELPWLVATLVASRLLSLWLYRRVAIACLVRHGGDVGAARYSAPLARRLFAFGGWVSVSSVIGPVLVQADRFFIASMISAAAVAVYVVPYELVTQSLTLVAAVSSVLFPELSRLMQAEPERWRARFRQWLLRVTVLMALTCSALALLLPWVLTAWIGDALDPRSIAIGQVLCLGVFANSAGSMYYAVIHAAGRADLTAKLHLVELPVFLLLLWLGLREYGLIGAAAAWVLRTSGDAVALGILVHRYAPCWAGRALPGPATATTGSESGSGSGSLPASERAPATARAGVAPSR